MTPPADTERYKHHRFPGEIISHGVWLYHRFYLSYRDVRELLFARGIDVTYEAIRHWCLKFGQDYANRLRRRRPRPGDTWHLDEVFLTIKGKRHYLWRAVDQDNNVLDILVQSRRNKKAACATTTNGASSAELRWDSEEHPIGQPPDLKPKGGGDHSMVVKREAKRRR